MCGRPLNDSFMWENETLQREAFSLDPMAHEIVREASLFGVSPNLPHNQSYGRIILEMKQRKEAS